MKLNKKRGFTIVELIIVIAVIAVLAAVLIPTFGGLINNAQEAKDTANVRMLNQALRADTSVNKHNTMHQAIAAAQNHGIDVTRLTATVPGNVILWDSENDLFAYYKVGAKGEIGEISYIPEFKPASKLQTAYKFWKVSKDVADLKGSYSVYWNGDNMTTAEVTVGFDAGVAEVGEVKYLRTTGDAQSVIIRTNGGSLTVNAPADSVSHYGKASKVDVVAVAGATYNEYGQVGYMQVASGRVVVDSASDVKVGAVLVVAAQSGNANNGVKLEVNKSDVQVAKESDAKVNEIVVNGAAVTDVKVATDEDKKQMQAQYGTFANGTGTEADPYQIANSAELKALSEKTNEGSLGSGKYFELVSDIDMADVEFAPIGTVTHPFNGVFDGQNHTVSNLTINSTTGDDGLFGFVKGDENIVDFYSNWNKNGYNYNMTGLGNGYTAEIKNLVLENATVKTTADKKATGAVVGSAIYASVTNITVKKSNVEGFKGVGGVIGNIDGAYVNNCSTDSSTTVFARVYNVGGIIGTTANTNSGDVKKASGIFNCKNYAAVTQNAHSGYAAGILGSGQNGQDNVISGCINYGKVVVKNIVKENETSSSYGVGGILGSANGVKLVLNCTNEKTATFEIENGKLEKGFVNAVAGISFYGSGITFYNCTNKASFSAPANSVAGITVSEGADLIACSNSGKLQNTRVPSSVYQLSTDQSLIEIENQTFTTVAELQSAIEQQAKSASASTAVVLTGVAVTDNSGVLTLPDGIQTIIADTKVCDSVVISDSLLTVDMVGLNQTISTSRTKTIIFGGKNATITVNANVTVDIIKLSGNNVKLVNNGTVGTVSIEQRAEVVEVENNGTMNRFDMVATSAKVLLTNKGTISRTDDKHTIHVESAGELELRNYGTISGKGNNPYALLFYDSCSVKMYAYSGSTVTGGFAPYRGQHSITIYYQDGTTIDGRAWTTVANEKYGVAVQLFK